MKAIIFIFILSIKYSSSQELPKEQCDCNIRKLPEEQVENGKTRNHIASAGVYPFVAAFVWKYVEENKEQKITVYKPFCSGVLLNSKFIMTSAYCGLLLRYYIEIHAYEMLAAVGAPEGPDRLKTITTDSKYFRVIKAGKVEVNIDYRLLYNSDRINDVALVNLDPPFELGSSTGIKAVCFSKAGEGWFRHVFVRQMTQHKFTVAGYGFQGADATDAQAKSDPDFSEAIRDLKFTRLTRANCRNDTRQLSLRNAICFENKVARPKDCAGDYGAPLLIDAVSPKDPKHTYVVLGGIYSGTYRPDPGYPRFVKEFTCVDTILKFTIVQGLAGGSDDCAPHKNSVRDKLGDEICFEPYKHNEYDYGPQQSAFFSGSTKLYVIFLTLLLACVYAVVLTVYSNKKIQQHRSKLEEKTSRDSH